MKKYVYLIVLLIVACQSKQEDIAYNETELTDVEASAIKLTQITSNTIFANPKGMEIIGDSMLLIFDNQSGDKCCHLMDLSGDLTVSFGEKGRSETELISPQNISFSPQRDSVFIYDYQQMKVLGYRISDLTDPLTIPTCNVYHLVELLSTRYNGAYNIGYGKYLGWGNNDNRFAIMQGSQILSKYTTYPAVDPDAECTWSIWGNLAHVAISPDLTYIVATTEIGALLEILKIDEDNINSKILKGYYPPAFSLAQGAKPKCVIYNEETISGFRCLYLANDYFLTNIGGPKFENVDEILFFDYSGNLLKKVKTDKVIVDLAVSSGNIIYMLAYDRETMELNLYRSDSDCISDIL